MFGGKGGKVVEARRNVRMAHGACSCHGDSVYPWVLSEGYRTASEAVAVGSLLDECPQEPL